MIKAIRTWLVKKLEVPGYAQLQREALIDKMGVTFTVALPGLEEIERILHQTTPMKKDWPQVQISPFLWEVDHKLFIIPQHLPINLIPGDQVIFTYHNREN